MVDRMLRYLETSAGRNRIIRVMERVIWISFIILMPTTLAGLYFKYS
jgi:hypothetical protein